MPCSSSRRSRSLYSKSATGRASYEPNLRVEGGDLCLVLVVARLVIDHLLNGGDRVIITVLTIRTTKTCILIFGFIGLFLHHLLGFALLAIEVLLLLSLLLLLGSILQRVESSRCRW